jgi:uncharacterized protein YbaR (Trm112 family)
MPLLPNELSAILVCPADRSTLIEDEAAQRLVCSSCGRAYPVKNGIPIMLIEETEVPNSVGGTAGSPTRQPGKGT